MDILRLLTSTTTVLQRILELDRRTWKRVIDFASRLTGHAEPGTSYENLSLSIELELCDRKGKKAILRRTQRVRFLAEETGVVRDVFWGNGRALAGYVVDGAERLAVRTEGSKQVVLLGLRTSAAKGESVTVRTERTILGAFERDEGYLETLVERETKRIRLSVLFPSGRQPTEVWLEATPPTINSRRLAVRLTSLDRGVATWGTENPKRLVTYRMRWTW